MPSLPDVLLLVLSSCRDSSNRAVAHTKSFFNPMYRPASHITPIALPNDSVQQQKQYQHTTSNHDNMMNYTIQPHDCSQWQLEHEQIQAMLPQFVTAHPVAAQSPIIPIYANNNHDAYLYNQWNKNNKNKKPTSKIKPTITPHITTPTYQTGYAPINIPANNDPFVTPTLETLCTLDTCSSDPTYNDTDAILNITI